MQKTFTPLYGLNRSRVFAIHNASFLHGFGVQRHTHTHKYSLINRHCTDEIRLLSGKYLTFCRHPLWRNRPLPVTDSGIKNSILKKKPSLINMPEQDNPFKGMEMAIDDFQPVKEKFALALTNKEYDILTSVIWEFDGAVNFAATGFEAPSVDIKGNPIQNLIDADTLAKHIFMMVFPEDNSTYCIISWLKENDHLFSEYKQQLDQLNEKERKNYINNTLPIISENIAVKPDSWDDWDEHKKNEFGSLLWGFSEIAEISGEFFDRAEPTLYDMFEM